MSNNRSNREFKKILSLNFLYEINKDGTIVRNVKSKHHLPLVKINDEYNVLIRNCWYSVRKLLHECELPSVIGIKAIYVTKDNICECFTSKKAAARYIAINTDTPLNSVYSRIKRQRSYINGYAIEYNRTIYQIVSS